MSRKFGENNSRPYHHLSMIKRKKIHLLFDIKSQIFDIITTTKVNNGFVSEANKVTEI